MAAQKQNRAAKAVKKRITKPAISKKKTRAPRIFKVDLSAFPPESIESSARSLCIACVWQTFTGALRLTPKIALAEMRRYTPSFDELMAPEAVRPFFGTGKQPAKDKQVCPYCGAPAKWHARIETHRIEGGKATDVPRRSLVKSLPKTKDQFVVLEQKATHQHAFFDWLDKISGEIDLAGDAWLHEVSMHYLSRKEPKVNWRTEFAGVHAIRRSRRLGLGEPAGEKIWEVDQERLFLTPMLFDELLLVQYLVSRSQLAGGLTLERRYTLPELWQRLRHSGYLRWIGVQATNASDALEQMLAYLGGGEGSVRFYYVIDRRQLLDRVKTLETERPRKTRASS